MIKVELQDNGLMLDITFKYHASYINRIKQVPCARFNPDEKKWVIPVGALDELEDQFKGELIYVTPRHKITGDPPPPPPDWYQQIPNTPVPSLKMSLYPFQQFGANFLAYHIKQHNFGLLCDSMGLGKTPSSIAAARLLLDEGLVHRVLVVCLASLKQQWGEDGISKFTDENWIVVKGTPKQREKIYQKAHEYRFMITNYELVLRDLDKLNALDFDLVIFDEVHKLKSNGGEMNEACKKLRAPNKVGLTGTPLMNRPDELYGIFNVLKPGFFGKYSEFKKRYLFTEWRGYVDLIGYLNLDELREKIGSHLLRRTPEEVGVQLPQMVIVNRFVEMTEKQKQIQEMLYDEMDAHRQALENAIANKLEEEVIKRHRMSIQGATQLLLGCADSPELFSVSNSERVKKKFGPLVVGVKTSSKLEELREIVEEIVDNGYKVVVFTQFKRMAEIIHRELVKIAPCVLYTGGMEQDERDDAKREFINDTLVKVFIATDAGYAGLNLQVAKYLINFDPHWNPTIVDQRNGRIRRINSTYDQVTIINLIARESIDESILACNANKRNLFTALVENTESQSKVLMERLRSTGSAEPDAASGEA